jgi:hypothetical protein
MHLAPNKLLVRIGLLSTVLHVLILLTMFCYSRFNYISYNMSRHEWFNGSISMLLLIEHVVWLHLLWSLARHPYYNLIISCLGVLCLTTSWIKQVVVPENKDPFQHHLIYAIVFGVGCTVNLFASLTLLPVASYRDAAGILAALAALACLTFVTVKFLRNDPATTIDWHIEPCLQMTAYAAYISALGVCLDHWAN